MLFYIYPIVPYVLALCAQFLLQFTLLYLFIFIKIIVQHASTKIVPVAKCKKEKGKKTCVSKHVQISFSLDTFSSHTNIQAGCIPIFELGFPYFVFFDSTDMFFHGFACFESNQSNCRTSKCSFPAPPHE